MKEAVATLDPHLEAVTRVLVERLQPRRIVLFGSRARGDGDAWSDYDILVEWETVLSKRERTVHVRAIVGELSRDMDFMVLTPEEFERQRDDVGTTAYHIHREGLVLYREAGVSPEALVPALARVREVPRGPPRSLPWWILRADSDFRIMEQSLATMNPVWDAICFHAHQSSEKLLKSVLVATHIPFKRIHPLRELLRQCPAELGTNVELRAACELLDELLPSARYPDDPAVALDDWMPTNVEGTRAAAAARAVRAIVLPVLERNAERSERVKRWERAVELTKQESRRALRDFQKHSRLRRFG